MPIESKKINAATDETRKLSILADNLPYALAQDIINKSPTSSIDDIYIKLHRNLRDAAKLYLTKEFERLTTKAFFTLQKECTNKVKTINTSIEKLNRIRLLAAIVYLSDTAPWIHEIKLINTTSILAIRAHLLKKINLKPISRIIDSTKINIIDLDQHPTQIALKEIDAFDTSLGIIGSQLTQTEFMQLTIAMPTNSIILNRIIKTFYLKYDKAVKEHAKVKKLIHQKETSLSKNIERLLRDHHIQLNQFAATAICNSPNKDKIVANLKRIIKTEQKRTYRKNKSNTYKQRTVDAPYEALSFITKFKNQSITQVMTDLYAKFTTSSPAQQKQIKLIPTTTSKETPYEPEDKLKSINFKIANELNDKINIARERIKISLKDLSCKLIYKEYILIQAHLDQLKKGQLPSNLNFIENSATADLQESSTPSIPNPNRFK